MGSPFVVIAFTAGPLVCWGLLARTKVMGWAFAAVLAGCAATEAMVLAGWIFAGEKVTLTVVLTAVTAVALTAGSVIESREPHVPGRRSIRGRTGIGLSIVFYGLCCLAGLGYAILAPDLGLISVPSSAKLLPPGPGLTVTSNTGSCSRGSAAICDRWIQLQRTAQVSEPDALARMRARLTTQYGFDLISDGGGGWAGCTDSSQKLCGQVDPGPGGITILLEASDECVSYQFCQKPPYSFGQG